jgi:peroxiredoxin
MLQAQIGSVEVMEDHSIPSRGHMMRDFILPSTGGTPVTLYDYRGHAGLVMIFAGDGAQLIEQGLLSAIVGQYAEIREQDTEVLLILTCPLDSSKDVKEQANVPFPVLVDENAKAHRSVGANVADVSIYVTDRFLEVFAGWRVAAGETLPSVSEIVAWITYINSLCPECTQVEWPKDDD